jgi:hypothetical protein
MKVINSSFFGAKFDGFVSCSFMYIPCIYSMYILRMRACTEFSTEAEKY